MGLLDMLAPASDGGGLLDFVKRNTAALPTPREDSDRVFMDGLLNAYAGAPSPLPPPSVWDRPGILYAPAPPPPPPSPFDSAPSSGVHLGGGAPVVPPIFNPPMTGTATAGPQTSAAAAAAAPPSPPGAHRPNDASPIAIGDYMMPRVGRADLYGSSASTAPPDGSAQRRAAPAPQIDATAQPGFMTAYQNFHNGGGLIGSIVAGFTGHRNDPQGIALEQQANTANLTARALMARNVDPQLAVAAVQPGNTDLLKQLFETNFGPGQFSSAGNGYVLNNKTGKLARGYTPDDRTPQSVLEYQFYLKNLKPGQQPMDYATFSTARARAGGATIRSGMSEDHAQNPGRIEKTIGGKTYYTDDGGKNWYGR
jgi:hypothetical protein